MSDVGTTAGTAAGGNGAAPARERLSGTPPNVRLLPLAALVDGAARNLVLQIGEGFFHGFVVRRGGSVYGYVDRCPHAGLPLAQALDHYMTDDGRLIMCSWHGALFEVEDGKCVAGPCSGARLTPWPLRVDEGVVFTA
ncbi:Rieske (2Fe-2S) protein [Chitinasiproducens palmae]|uniref:Ferredoxin subunit of nitrite reductase or a ring-hydroxylating dioxygenase n=1 Tax=Chitinasiproducens palmae TaxID=1770053 RepID=A0A1H2PIK2_9BURK|nr:Rieske (2Fe-2S) protein [Chitinasiproducens palmae]SDV46081.1 Ferredoxin subunit of nitrite reductase or a ring-hydroxylating dioxygenase [Chitinasiproducens palmae]